MFATSQSALETYFKNNWSHTGVDWENAPLITQTLNEFVRFSVQYGDAQVIGMGRRCTRVAGVVYVQVFVRPGVGLARAMILADYAAALLNVDTIGVHTMTSGASVIKPPVRQGDEWVQVQVAADFYFDEVI